MFSRTQRRTLWVALWTYLLWLSWLPLHAQTAVKTLGEGVVLKQYVQTFYNSPQIVNVLEVDLRNPAVRVESALAGGTVYRQDPTLGRETVSETVQRLDALAGVNADFFPFTGDPLGIHIQGGELVSEPSQRVAFGMTAQREVIFGEVVVRAEVTPEGGNPLPLSGINRTVQANECVLVTPRWGEVYPLPNGAVVLSLRELDGVPMLGKTLRAKVGEPIAAGSNCAVPADGALLVATGTQAERIKGWQSGTVLSLRFWVDPASQQVVLVPESRREGATQMASRGGFRRRNEADFWAQAVMAVGGGPWLVREGTVLVDAPRQGFQSGFSDNRHPRTAVGITADGKLLLVTVDGRQPMAGGMTLHELARLMIDLGATDAINLDGGGSTTLAVRGGLVINSPSEGKQRPVANSVVVFAPRPAVTESAQVQIEPTSVTVRSGESVRFAVRSPEKGEPLNPDKVIFGTTGGIGFVDQAGLFTGVKIGKGTVTALLPDDRLVQAEVTVLPGEPARVVLVQPTTVPSGGERFELVVRVADQAGNPCAGVKVQMRAQGAYPAEDSTVADASGVARFTVAWDANLPTSQCSITVTVPESKAVSPLKVQRR
ncbi:MAG: phosphodiester glycosidase family protein [Chthonomonadetes bacterium]|nr:phosphodiester glycosidase family protein [Chthonomonadetes bacterium]